MHSTSSTDKLYSQLTALTSGKKYFLQVTGTVPTLSQAKSISCRQFAHMQPTYFTQKHLLESALCTCSPLTSGKSISCRQFHTHKQYSTSSTKTQIHAVHLIRRRNAFYAGSFNTYILYTCTKSIQAISTKNKPIYLYKRNRQTDGKVKQVYNAGSKQKKRMSSSGGGGEWGVYRRIPRERESERERERERARERERQRERERERERERLID